MGTSRQTTNNDKKALLRKCGLKVDEVIEEVSTTQEEIDSETYNDILRLIKLKKLIKNSNSSDAISACKEIDRIINLRQIGVHT